MAEHVRFANSRAMAQKKTTSSVKILRYLYKDVDGREVSLQHRKIAKDSNEESVNDAHLTYGEVNSQSFLQILALVENLRKTAQNSADSSEAKVFVDLGCGTGVAVLCAALSSSGFSKVWGVELVPGLTNEALKCQQQLLKMIENPSSCATSSNEPKPISKKVKVLDASSVASTALRILNEHLLAHNSTSMTVEAFANLLCKELGHKTYKALIIKTHKAFIKYLKSCEQFALSDSDSVVQPSQTTVNEDVESTTEETHCNAENSIPSGSSSSAKLDPSDLLLYAGTLPEIVFETNDIFKVDWHLTADVVYAASLLFSEDMMIQLSEQVHRMKSGAYFINLRELPPPPPSSLAEGSSNSTTNTVELVSESFFKMSWQMAKVYIYRIK